MKEERIVMYYKCDNCNWDIPLGYPHHIKLAANPIVIDLCLTCFDSIIETFKLLKEKLNIDMMYEVIEHEK